MKQRYYNVHFMRNLNVPKNNVKCKMNVKIKLKETSQWRGKMKRVCCLKLSTHVIIKNLILAWLKIRSCREPERTQF